MTLMAPFRGHACFLFFGRVAWGFRQPSKGQADPSVVPFPLQGKSERRQHLSQ